MCPKVTQTEAELKHWSSGSVFYTISPLCLASWAIETGVTAGSQSQLLKAVAVIILEDRVFSEAINFSGIETEMQNFDLFQ